MKKLTKYQELVEMGKEKVRLFNQTSEERTETINEMNAETNRVERGCLELTIKDLDRKMTIIAAKIETIVEIGNEIFGKGYEEFNEEIHKI